MKIKYLFSLLMIGIFLITSCTNSGDSPKSSGKKKNQETEPQEKQNDGCNCSNADADGLVSKIMWEFNQRQNELESQDARVIKFERLEQRPNCSWIATFKISQAFSSTGEFIRKRLICDGKEIYTE